MDCVELDRERGGIKEEEKVGAYAKAAMLINVPSIAPKSWVCPPQMSTKQGVIRLTKAPEEKPKMSAKIISPARE